jgi:hypothetical protein
MLFSRQVKIGKAISVTTTSLNKSSSVWTFSRRKLTDSRKHCFYLTMQQHIKSGHLMHLVLTKMLKGLKLSWTPHPGGPKMRDTVLPDGSIQSFYFPDDHPSMPGWFKGMKFVLEE